MRLIFKKILPSYSYYILFFIFSIILICISYFFREKQVWYLADMFYEIWYWLLVTLMILFSLQKYEKSKEDENLQELESWYRLKFDTLQSNLTMTFNQYHILQELAWFLDEGREVDYDDWIKKLLNNREILVNIFENLYIWTISLVSILDQYFNKFPDKVELLNQIFAWNLTLRDVYQSLFTLTTLDKDNYIKQLRSNDIEDSLVESFVITALLLYKNKFFPVLFKK